jgi:hypothetical protein
MEEAHLGRRLADGTERSEVLCNVGRGRGNRGRLRWDLATVDWGASQGGGEYKLFAFLTIEADNLVQRVHATAMPVLLTVPDWDT